MTGTIRLTTITACVLNAMLTAHPEGCHLRRVAKLVPPVIQRSSVEAALKRLDAAGWLSSTMEAPHPADGHPPAVRPPAARRSAATRLSTVP